MSTRGSQSPPSRGAAAAASSPVPGEIHASSGTDDPTALSAGGASDSSSLQRLEAEVRMHQILTHGRNLENRSTTTAPYQASSSLSPPTSPSHHHHHPKEDDLTAISNLTEDGNNTNSSIISKATSIMSQSLALLRGENPLLQLQQQELLEEQQEQERLESMRRFSFPETDEFVDADRSSDECIDFLKDSPADMTYSRRIALTLMKYKWYNPKVGDDLVVVEEKPNGDNNGEDRNVVPEINLETVRVARPLLQTELQRPSLPRAWAYFEHVAMPRFVFRPKENAVQKNFLVRIIRKMSKANKTMDRAEPGEKYLPTKLYSPIFTPLKQMGDFGLGIGLYFSTLRAVTILTVLAGLLNIPNIIYFSGDDYSNGQPGVKSLLKGSAICTDTVWVPCPDCIPADFTDDRIANGTTVDLGGNIVTIPFALHNNCDGATLTQGMINYGTLLLILVGIGIMSIYQKRMEIAFDEDEQTAQDYSIVIDNPPPDASDPKEWKRFFFENFDGAHITTITIAVDNDFLVRSLLERRECMRKIEMLVEPGTKLDPLTLARIAAQTERDRTFTARLLAMLLPGVPEHFGRVTVLTAKVQGFAQQDYPVSNIFITFETEADQRRVLKALSVGSLAAWRNKVSAVPKQCLFRGKHVLNVQEPDEPSTVRWQDLNTKFPARIKQLLTTTIATVGAIILIAFIIRLTHNTKAAFTAIVISVFNSIFPMFAKFLTNLESHSAEGGKQTSLYFKIAAFRWVNTAIVITIITPFTETLDKDGLIPSIYAIFFAEMVTTNAIQFLDPFGHLQRHYFAPRAATQDMMNLNMQGQVFELAERYTNMTKILFLALWYCSIYPAALFMCSFILFLNFFVDRFSLMRTWKRAPQLGTSISQFSRRYFFSTAIVAMAVVSSYYWSGFRFDNLCVSDNSVNNYLNGTSTIPDGATWQIITKTEAAETAPLPIGTAAPVTIKTRYTSTEDTIYSYCLQDLLRTRNFPAIAKFQPEGSEWMEPDQETVTNIYGWTSVAVLCLVLLMFVWGWVESAQGLFRSSYSPNGKDQGIGFSEVASISAYVPQVSSTVFSYPLLACNIDGLDEDLFDWTDPDHPFSYYDLTKDADDLLAGTDVSFKHVFSKVVHWPPEKKDPVVS